MLENLPFEDYCGSSFNSIYVEFLILRWPLFFWIFALNNLLRAFNVFVF